MWGLGQVYTFENPKWLQISTGEKENRSTPILIRFPILIWPHYYVYRYISPFLKGGDTIHVDFDLAEQNGWHAESKFLGSQSRVIKYKTKLGTEELTIHILIRSSRPITENSISGVIALHTVEKISVLTQRNDDEVWHRITLDLYIE